MKNLLNAGIAFLSLSLAGCNLYEPTGFTDNRVQVKEEMLMHDMALDEVNEDFIGGLARHYVKHGGSPMDIIVTYDPKSYRNTAMKATDQASHIVTSLKDHGITSVDAGIMPIKSQGDEARLLISYTSYSAHAPKGCDGEMSGMDGNELGYNENYKLGCSTKRLVAKQVAKPKHLLGNGRLPAESEGRSATNIVDYQRAGIMNEALDGESASE